MNKKLAIIHTTPVTIGNLKDLAYEIMPQVKVINLLDDSILPELIKNGGDLDMVKERWFTYAQIADKIGCDVILSACSSVGDLADDLNGKLHAPVLRIDEAMADRAVATGGKIGVAATLNTTLKPTINLLERKARLADKKMDIECVLADEAYERLINGDGEGHDRILAEQLYALSQRVDVVVLAQASMARLLDKLPNELKGKFLTSPRIGMLRVKDIMERMK